MICTRRQFLGTTLSTAAILPLAAKGLLPNASRRQEDQALLDQLQRASFDFFWHETDPLTGLVRDRANAEGGGEHAKSSIAATTKTAGCFTGMI